MTCLIVGCILAFLSFFRNTILIQIRFCISESICINGQRTGIGKRATTMMNKKGVRTHTWIYIKGKFCFWSCIDVFIYVFFGYGRVLKIKNKATILRGRWGVGRGGVEDIWSFFLILFTIWLPECYSCFSWRKILHQLTTTR